MWADSANELVEFFRGSVPYYLVVALPILIIMSPVPVDAAAEFGVYRLQQYDLHGQPHGSRSSLVNVEARTLDSNVLGRRCVVVRLVDLTVETYQRVVNEAATALLILMPETLNSLTTEQKEGFWSVESAMLSSDSNVAVYFASETPVLTEIYEGIKSSTNTDDASSAAAALFGSVSANGYQLVVTGSQAKAVPDLHLANIHGKLSGYGAEEQLPTIAIVAHYDSFGAAADLSVGADSNASGVSILLEVARVLSRLYSSQRTHPKFNILFLLSSGTAVNYQGSKRYLEDQLEASDSPLLANSRLTLCLDSLGEDHNLRLHVSKKPKESSAGEDFYERLVAAGEREGVEVEMVHKKINLQDEVQAWEHEKFSMRRLPAFTLSRLHAPFTGERTSILDVKENVDPSTVTRNARIVTSALLGHIFNSSVDNLFQGGLEVSEESVSAWLNALWNEPRSPQLMASKTHPLVTTLHEALNRYVSEAKVTWFRADKRDPDWLFYDVTKSTMAAYSVKPAIFDLILTLAILAYLGVVYGVLMYFPLAYASLVRFVSPQKSKSS